MSNIQYTTSASSDSSLTSSMDRIADHADLTITESLNRTKTIWERLFPSEIARAVNAGEQSLVGARYRGLFESLTLVQKAQIQYVKERMDNVLKQHEAQLTSETDRIVAAEIKKTITFLEQMVLEKVAETNQALEKSQDLPEDLRQIVDEFLRSSMMQFIQGMKNRIAHLDALVSENKKLFSGLL
jgi:dGTP triphosphohydrolase